MEKQTTTFTIEYTLSDIYDVYLAVSPVAPLRIPFFALGLAGLLLAILFHQFSWLFICSCALIGASCGATFQLRRAARKTFEAPAFSTPKTISLNDQGVEVKAIDSEGKVAWNHYQNWRETKTAIVIYPNPYVFQIFPKRCLSREEQADLLELVSSNVQKRKDQTKAILIGLAVLVVVGFIGGVLSSIHH